MNAEDIGRRAKEIRAAEERAMFGAPGEAEAANGEQEGGDCPDCDGQGVITTAVQSTNVTAVCQSCAGTGRAAA